MSTLMKYDWKNCYEELLSYYPTFYRDVLEMNAILKAQGDVADDIISAMETGFANAFLQTADMETVERYEKFLGITSDETQSDDERRKLLITYFAGFGKVSASQLCTTIEKYSGCDVTATFEPADDDNNNLLSFFVESGEEGTIQIAEIFNILNRRLPAHIWHCLNIAYNKNVNLYFGLVSVYLREMDLSCEDVSSLYLCDENGDVLTDEDESILI